MNSMIKLRDGNSIPRVGLGTWKLQGEKKDFETVVQAAWDAGYRHLDTAAIYNNEQQIGGAIRALKIPRDKLFITTKLWVADFGYDSAIKAAKASLKKLQIDSIDLYLIHWPYSTGSGPGENDAKMRSDTWRAMIEIQKQKMAKSIGVSNFCIPHLKELEKGAIFVFSLTFSNSHCSFFLFFKIIKYYLL